MEMNGTFDTLGYTKRLEAAGVPAEQAEAHALALGEVLRMQLATKVDLQLANTELSDKIELVRFELKARMERMETKHTADIAELRGVIRDEIHGLRTEIMRWVFGLWIGQSAVLFAALAYFRS